MGDGGVLGGAAGLLCQVRDGNGRATHFTVLPVTAAAAADRLGPGPDHPPPLVARAGLDCGLAGVSGRGADTRPPIMAGARDIIASPEAAPEGEVDHPRAECLFHLWRPFGSVGGGAFVVAGGSGGGRVSGPRGR